MRRVRQEMNGKETLKTLTLACVVGVTVFVAATPVCILILGVNSCERMMCEILVMKRPHSDVSYCEDWFDFFR